MIRRHDDDVCADRSIGHGDVDMQVLEYRCTDLGPTPDPLMPLPTPLFHGL